MICSDHRSCHELGAYSRPFDGLRHIEQGRCFQLPLAHALDRVTYFLRGLACVLVFTAMAGANAQSIVVSRSAWEALTADERAAIQNHHVVDARDGASYGEIVDAQGIDQSTPGTKDGSTLGAAIGNAAYIDRAFKPDNNYSAKTQLAAIVLGAVIGSALDKPAQAQFRFRYAIRLASGEIEYRDIIQTELFRHPVGICIDLNLLEKVPQSLCIANSDGLRARYLKEAAKKSLATTPQTTAIVEPAVKSESSVQCKPANLAAITTTREKCLLINGEIL